MDKAVVKLGVLIGLVATLGVVASEGAFTLSSIICSESDYCRWGWLILTVTLIVIMIVCLFGMLALPGGRDDQGRFKEERIRLSIAVTLIVVYFVLFSNAVYFGEGDQSINPDMMKTITSLMTIVLPFYFGTSGLVEWAKRKEKKDD